jgi:PAS domain S-box-containing protein
MVIQRTSFSTPWTLIAVFLILVCSIGATGYFFYLDQKKQIKGEKQKELLAVAELKTRTIARWRGDHFDDSRVIFNNQLLSSLVARWLRAGAPASDMQREIVSWMTGRQQYYHYDQLVLFSPAGKKLLAVPDQNVGPATELERKWIDQAVTDRKPVFSDIYRDPSSEEIRANISIPLLAPGTGDKQPMAVMMILENPELDLFPLVRSWPTQSRTAESLLVRREGNRVVFLNELRHRRNTALFLEASVSDRSLVAAKAVRGAEGIVEGLDYRGVPVIAAVKKIPSSSWHLIAKVDSDEVYAPVRERARLLGGVTALLILAAGVVVFLLWRQTQFRFYRERYDAERQHLSLAQRFESFTRHANDAILLMDDGGRVLEANERAISWYGYSRDEFLQLTILDLRAPETMSLVDSQLGLAWSLEGVVFETDHQRKGGDCFPVEVSSRVVRIGGEWFYQSIIRDISERRAAERQLRQKHQELERLNKTLEELVREEVARNREKDHLLIQQSRLAAMGEMIGNIAHQWRQPLNVIGLLVQTLPEYHRNGALTEEILDETVQQAMNVIGYMSRTTTDFRNFFKPDKEKREFPLQEVFDQSLSFLTPHLHYHNVEISLSVSGDMRAVGYPNEYSQVLINIIGNAKEVFIERAVANPKITITAFEEAGRSVVTIADNGGGILEPVLDRIFEPYFTSKQGAEGTGLGLYMSKIIIEKNMQGSLTVRNTEEGAEFRIVV